MLILGLKNQHSGEFGANSSTRNLFCWKFAVVCQKFVVSPGQLELPASFTFPTDAAADSVLVAEHLQDISTCNHGFIAGIYRLHSFSFQII